MKSLQYIILSGLWLTLLSCQPKPDAMAPDPSIAFIGSYTQKEGHVDGKGAGISVYETGPTAADWKLLSTFPDIINPSFLCLSPNLPVVYAVSEQGPGVPPPGSVIKVIQYDPENFAMTEIQSVPALGDAPCYISTDREGGFLFAANYVTGNVIQYIINEDGTLQPGQSRQHYGSGPHARQEAPHAHYIKPHPAGEAIYAVDLGTDQVIRYQADEAGLQPRDTIHMETGAGPRHLVWHGNGQVVYVLNELTGAIECWDWSRSPGERLQVVALNPDPEQRFAGAADIHMTKDNRFIYASLRGDFNEIAVLSVDPETLGLELIQRVPAGGNTPRNFAISPAEDYLAVALQDSDRIMLFARDADTGRLGETPEVVEVKTPVCVVYQ